MPSKFVPCVQPTLGAARLSRPTPLVALRCSPWRVIRLCSGLWTCQWVVKMHPHHHCCLPALVQTVQQGAACAKHQHHQAHARSLLSPQGWRQTASGGGPGCTGADVAAAAADPQSCVDRTAASTCTRKHSGYYAPRVAPDTHTAAKCAYASQPAVPRPEPAGVPSPAVGAVAAYPPDFVRRRLLVFVGIVFG